MNQLMDRREALRKTALLMGAAVSATAFAGIMQGCKATPELTYTPSFLNLPTHPHSLLKIRRD